MEFKGVKITKELYPKFYKWLAGFSAIQGQAPNDSLDYAMRWYFKTQSAISFVHVKPENVKSAYEEIENNPHLLKELESYQGDWV